MNALSIIFAAFWLGLTITIATVGNAYNKAPFEVLVLLLIAGAAMTLHLVLAMKD